MTRIDAMKKLEDLADQAYEILRDAYGIGPDLNINIFKGKKYVEIRQWGEPDENGDYHNTPRRDLLDVSCNPESNEWGRDFSESSNYYYKTLGKLMEVAE